MASVNAMNTRPGPLAACWINVQVVLYHNVNIFTVLIELSDA